MRFITRFFIVAAAFITISSSAFAVPTVTSTPNVSTKNATKPNLPLLTKQILARVDYIDATSMQVTEIVDTKLVPSKTHKLVVDAKTKFSSQIIKGNLVEVTYNAAGHALFVNYAKP